MTVLKLSEARVTSLKRRTTPSERALWRRITDEEVAAECKRRSFGSSMTLVMLCANHEGRLRARRWGAGWEIWIRPGVREPEWPVSVSE